MADLLFELGTEELPARFVVPALDAMERVFCAECLARGLQHGLIHRYGTPRRLALLVADVSEYTERTVRTVQGPAVRVAFDKDGQPKTPAIKFAESLSLTVSELQRVQTPKGEYLSARIVEDGRPAMAFLSDVLNRCLRGIEFPKSMRWGDVEQSFGRPLHWIVAMLGPEIVPMQFADVRSGRTTYGHRFLSPGEITISDPKDYESLLERAHVIADIDLRRARMIEGLQACAAEAQGQVLLDPALVDQVVNLVELPNAVLGTFEERHLDLPPEVLIQEMKIHQRYFPITGDDGKLLPRFIAVSNTPVVDVKLSVKGYERVLRARLTDGRFFFDQDRQTRLADRIPKLARVTWQAKLDSSYADKVERFRALAAYLAEQTDRVDRQPVIDRASMLCKADLVTAMVGEFPELQGVMGREYAMRDGEPQEVALAIYEHYLPRTASDAMPTEDAGALVGIADRLDTICGLFAIGEKPTGAKDQYGLRRAAIAVINIVLSRGYRFSLSGAIRESVRLLAPKISNVSRRQEVASVETEVLEFFRERLRPLWNDRHRPDVIEAILGAGFDDLVTARERLDALSAWVKRSDFATLATTFKRVGNIVQKQAMQVSRSPANPHHLVTPEEQMLYERLASTRGAVHEAVADRDYVRAMENVALLKPAVDLFFEKVTVMVDDISLRDNRVALLAEIGTLFGAIADFSRIQSEG